MTGNRLEKEIMGIFSRDISSFLSINQISKKLNKAYPHINAKVNQLIEEGILNKISIGRSYQCSINLNNEKAIAMLILNESEKKENYLKKIAISKKLIDDIHIIKKEFRVYTILLHGPSLLFVLDYLNDKEAIKNMFKTVKQHNALFFDREGFMRYILENPDILSNHSILYSYEKYFEFLSEIKDTMILSKINSNRGNVKR